MSRGFGTILTAGVAGTVLWAYGKSRQQAADDAQPQVIVIPAATGDSKSDRTRDLIFGLAGILGAASGSDKGKAPTQATRQPITETIANAVGFDWPAWAGGGATSTGAGDVGPLKRIIQSKEGGVGGYNTPYGGSKLKPPRPLTSMTIDQVLAYQDASVARGSASSAMGAYQIIRKTLRGLVSRGVAKGSDRFDAATQERLGDALLRDAGIDKYRAGRWSEQQFGQGLAKMWASLPAMDRDAKGRAPTGQSYYAGDGLNKAHHSIYDVLQAIRKVK